MASTHQVPPLAIALLHRVSIGFRQVIRITERVVRFELELFSRGLAHARIFVFERLDQPLEAMLALMRVPQRPTSAPRRARSPGA